MATNYPAGIDSLTNPGAGDALNSPSHAGQHTNANDAIEAIETELGTNPKGSAATVKARLDAIETGARLGTNSIGATQLADSAVNTAAIQDGAVTAAKLATSGRFLFPTGAANGYGFTSGATHLSSTGSPEGVITAAPGSSWLQIGDAITVSGNLLWRKATGTGSTGWTPEGALADTGWRGLTPLSPSNTTVSWLQIRRTGSVVAVSYRIAITDTAWKAVYGVLTGFGPRGGYVSGICPRPGGDGPLDGVQWYMDSAFNLTLRADNGSLMDGGFTYMTNDAWPSSLPGSAA